jgi:CRISPR/Cas system CSM-associated protein Csm3 (group 7 of RAMP superfamily)
MAVSNEEQGAIVARYIAEGTYRLESAAHFGSGEEGKDTDLAIMRDASGNPIIPGSALAGVCRSYLAYYLDGAKAFTYLDLNNSVIGEKQSEREKQERALRLDEEKSIRLLFGEWQFKGNDEGGQSALIVYDAYPPKEEKVEIAKRDGVKIEAKTGQAEKGAKYDFEVVEAGTAFSLRFELIIRQGYSTEEAENLKKLLGLVLTAFEQGEIRLGAKTRRGLGLGKVAEWRVQDWDFSQSAHILEWLEDKQPTTPRPHGKVEQGARNYLDIEATFELTDSLLVRSYVEEVNQPDAVHLHSRRADGKSAPLIPGSSALGVMRHRAERILRTFLVKPVKPDENEVVNEEAVKKYSWSLFGIAGNKGEERAGRLRVEEEWLEAEKIVSEIQSRIQIDRLTGGVMPGALFDEMPVWGQGAVWRLRCRLLEPQEHEIGLLLQVLKDMWLGDLTIGGGVGIGRGVLRGQSVNITWQCGEAENKEWSFRQVGDKLVFEIGTPKELNEFAIILYKELTNNV